jgi:nicotinamidase/pyrazinamidase
MEGMTKKALIIVDVQNDFIPGGALPVPEGHQVVAVINELQLKFELVVATQDWHPAGHGSFASSHPGKNPGDIISLNGLTQILWPDHCVQGTLGAQFVQNLHIAKIARVFRKGTDPEVDSYSGLFDNGHRKDTGLGDYLKDQKVDDVYIVGLATDYCVKFTALDCRDLGFRTHVLQAGCRAVNLQAGDGEHALDQMRRAGVLVE